MKISLMTRYTSAGNLDGDKECLVAVLSWIFRTPFKVKNQHSVTGTPSNA